MGREWTIQSEAEAVESCSIADPELRKKAGVARGGRSVQKGVENEVSGVISAAPNSASTIEQSKPKRSEGGDSEQACSENLADDDDLDCTSSAFSEFHSEILFDGSEDTDFLSDSLWSDNSGSQFSLNSAVDSVSSPFVVLSRQYLQFNRLSSQSFNEVQSSAIDEFADEFVYWRFENEDDEQSYQRLRSRERERELKMDDYVAAYASTIEYGLLIHEQRLLMVHWIVEGFLASLKKKMMNGVEMTKEAKFDCLLFDLDDILYPLSSGINLSCRKNIQEYMLKHLHIEESLVPKMCLDFYKEYGTTMAGLKANGYEFDDDEFHEYVHGRLPYETLTPDPVLRSILLSMPQRKIVFTNSDKAHTARVLSRLGLEDCFEGVICFETLNPKNTCDPTSKILCKPSVEAMEAAIRIANIDPSRTIFFDDSTRNIASGKAAGLHTIFVGSSVPVAGADHALSSLHNVREALPEIWEAQDDQLNQVVQYSAVVETINVVA